MSTEIFEVNGVTVANVKNKSGIALFGIAVRAGSNYETPDIAGISHFAEHMFFKRTKTRNWRQINEEFAKLGVNNNAYTDNTEVFYHTTCPKENMSKVIALMMDMFFNSTYPEDELEKERGVIMEEKKMYDDDHRAFFSSQIGDNFFVWHLGHETIGTAETIASISREQIVDYLNQKVSLDNLIFICCGDIDSNDLRKYLEDNMPTNHPYIDPKRVGVNGMSDGLWTGFTDKSDKIKLIVEREGVTQATIHSINDNLPSSDPLYHHSNILTEALGGGMYSLLFSRIREELGLCYSVGCFGNFMSYPDKRTFNIYSSVATKNVQKYIDEVEKVIEDVVKNGISKDIFECAKTDNFSSVLRATETSAGLSMFMVSKILTRRNASIEDTLDKIRAVDLDGCNQLAKKMFSKPRNWAVMIPKGESI